MLYATNGKTQDLPPGTQFLFWDQVQWGKAFQIAKVEQNLRMGASVAPRHELDVHLLMESQQQDPYKVFVSRPASQAPDWVAWSSFAWWYFSMDPLSRSSLLGDIHRGQIATWFPAWMQNAHDNLGYKRKGGYCYLPERVDTIVFWDHHEFDKNKCQSTRRVPPSWPTPEELAQMQVASEWLAQVFGGDDDAMQRFVDSPPTASERASATSPTAPPSVDSGEVGGGTDETSGTWIAIGALGLAVGLGVLLWPRGK